MYICFIKHPKSNKRYLFDCTDVYGKVCKGSTVLCDTIRGHEIGWVVSLPRYVEELDINTVTNDACVPLKKIIRVMDKIRLTDIKISDDFKKTIPNPFKIAKCVNFYRVNRRLDSDIVIDKNNVLVDGYVRYLVAKMFDVKKVEYIRKIK